MNTMAYAHSPGFLALVNEAKSRIRELTIDEGVEKLQRGDPFHFIDTREDSEWTAGRAQGAIPSTSARA
jgi:hypothetical protein